ncbi:VOC family protein [Marivirga sp. S37H4]|uniref:VOC family protein n=1 Tax=Marivirga aurantiaca TaxID=2802615 RepID=A0A934WYZ8_9BACT|nr:VOC family protein [Marivirga aurantiaca]MBK6265793.1 VOC family protein [Marivirga aurantiaca]
MKKFISVLVLGLFLTLPNSITAQVKLNHIAVYVENLKESTDFYQSIIGLEQIEEPFKDGLHTWFKLGNSQLHLIEGEWKAVTINKNNHLCFSIPNMESFISKLEKEEIAFEDWPGKPNAITKRVDGVQQVYFKDPNGYWIEVNDDY